MIRSRSRNISMDFIEMRSHWGPLWVNVAASKKTVTS
jgi:hypothetical protein